VTTALACYVLMPRPAWAQCADGSPPPCSRPATPAPAPPNSVAVLYFDNISADSADAYLAEGMSEELISRLSQVDRLSVKSRTAVQRLRGRPLGDPAALGRSLSVSHLVSGSVRHAAGRLRVTVELTRSATGMSVWSRTFDRPATDLIAVEAEIAESVAVGVSGRLLPAERQRIEARPTASTAAYDRFLRGNFEVARRTPAAIRRAIGEYEAASLADPRYAAPLVHEALAYNLLTAYQRDPGSVDSLRARANSLLEQALRLDSSSAEAWLARATIFQPDMAVAVAASELRRRDAFTRAVTLDPRNAEAHHLFGLFLRNGGEDSAAANEFRRALAIEPQRAITLVNLGQIFVVGRQAGEAGRWFDSAVALGPDAGFYYVEQGLNLIQRGDTAAARRAAELASGHGDRNGAAIVLAMLDARAGNQQAGRARLAPVDSALGRTDCSHSHPCLELAGALAATGDRDRALAVLDRVARDRWIVYWGRRPELDPVRDDRRFLTILAEAGRRN
jgi:TolB-like protein/Tfp pilus assembly protein PilF